MTTNQTQLTGVAIDADGNPASLHDLIANMDRRREERFLAHKDKMHAIDPEYATCNNAREVLLASQRDQREGLPSKFSHSLGCSAIERISELVKSTCHVESYKERAMARLHEGGVEAAITAMTWMQLANRLDDVNARIQKIVADRNTPYRTSNGAVRELIELSMIFAGLSGEPGMNARLADGLREIFPPLGDAYAKHLASERAKAIAEAEAAEQAAAAEAERIAAEAAAAQAAAAAKLEEAKAAAERVRAAATGGST